MADSAPTPVPVSGAPGGVVELNVGGVFYSTTLETLKREPGGLLSKIFSDPNKAKALRDSKGRYFIDRDGVLFRYVLDYLRNLRLVLPENFHEKDRLRQEAEHFRLPNLVKIASAYPSPKPFHISSPTSLARVEKDGEPSKPAIAVNSISTSTENTTDVARLQAVSPSKESRGDGFITLGYRGTFAFGRDGLADVKFRKLSRIIVCGKVSLCREVFKDTLNESRDPDRGETDRYTSRFFLKHSFLEQAFDMLQEEGFSLVASCGSGTNSAGEVKPGLDTEEAKWQHYNEFIFERH